MSVGMVFAVLGTGLLVGFLGRLVMPGRHGLLLVVVRDLKLLPRILAGSVPGRIGVMKVIARDIPLRWCLASGVVGAFGGYVVGSAYAPAGFGFFWALAGALIALIALMLADIGRRTAPTRRLGLRGSA